MTTDQKVTLEPVALFATAIERLRADLANGRDPEDAIFAAYDLCGDVRNMSRDDAWQDPCNRFRTAVQERTFTKISAAALAAEGEARLAALPNAALQPLDYWTPRAEGDA